MGEGVAGWACEMVEAGEDARAPGEEMKGVGLEKGMGEHREKDLKDVKNLKDINGACGGVG